MDHGRVAVVGEDLIEAMNVAEEVRRGERHRVDGRLLVAALDFAGRLEQELIAAQSYLDRFDREEIRKRLEGRDGASA